MSFWGEPKWKPKDKEVQDKIQALYDVYHVYNEEHFLKELETTIKAALYLIWDKCSPLEAIRVLEAIRDELIGE